MSAFVSALAAGLAIAALGLALLTLGRRLRALEERSVNPPAPAPTRPPAPVPGGRPSRPMLTALYPEPAPSPLAGLGATPGGTWFAAAIALTVVSVATSGRSSRPAAAVEAPSDSGLVLLQARVDSLGQEVQRLRDSVQLARAAAAPSGRRAVATAPTPRAAAPAGVIPASPPPPLISSSPASAPQ